jgi:hypothetical protein
VELRRIGDAAEILSRWFVDFVGIVAIEPRIVARLGVVRINRQ